MWAVIDTVEDRGPTTTAAGVAHPVVDVPWRHVVARRHAAADGPRLGRQRRSPAARPRRRRGAPVGPRRRGGRRGSSRSPGVGAIRKRGRASTPKPRGRSPTRRRQDRTRGRAVRRRLRDRDGESTGASPPSPSVTRSRTRVPTSERTPRRCRSRDLDAVHADGGSSSRSYGGRELPWLLVACVSLRECSFADITALSQNTYTLR